MSDFARLENARQVRFKNTWPCLSPAARESGVVRGHTYPFCLPVACADENLFEDVRDTALAYFQRNRIKWHLGQNHHPSNHLRSSQVCCVNFLEPFATRPEALAALLCPLYGEITMLPIEDRRFVAYEWIGADNYLHEVTPRNGVRQRGALYTSADAAVRFRRADGSVQVALIEWKYTEAYSKVNLIHASSGADRREIYRHLWERDDCPLDRQWIPCFSALFYEPFYQLMRQQLLAHEMERVKELEADVVSTLHLAPAANTAVERITSPALHALGDSVSAVWARVVRPSDRFQSATTEKLFGAFQPEPGWGLGSWKSYLEARYAGALGLAQRQPDQFR